MQTMKSVQTGAAGAIEVVDLDVPAPGPDDVLVRVRAFGICGTDGTFLHLGGGPFGPGGQMIPVPLGHEAAGEVVEVGADMTGVSYPTEIFEVTPELVKHSERFARLISHRVPFSNVEEAYDLATTPGAAEKVIVTFDDADLPVRR